VQPVLAQLEGPGLPGSLGARAGAFARDSLPGVGRERRLPRPRAY